MATLVKQSGRYYLQFYDKNRTPKRKKTSLKTSRKRPAKAKQRELEDAFVEGRYDPWVDDPFSYDRPSVEDMDLSEAQERFLQRKEKDGRSSNTIRTYREVLNTVARTAGEDCRIRTINASLLRDVIRDPSISKATQHKRYGHLNTFFRWCVKESLLRENPLTDVAKPDKPHKLPKAIHKDELKALCDALREDYEMKRSKGFVQEGEMIWRIPLFWFAFYTGMRASELARLRWRDVGTDKHLIYIRKQKNKKEQTIPFNTKAQEALSGVRGGTPNDYVFRSPYFSDKKRSTRCFRERASKAFRKAHKLAGLRSSLSFHSLRHGFCTMLAEAGCSAVVIKEAARHADLSTSMHYVHLTRSKLRIDIDDALDDSQGR